MVIQWEPSAQWDASSDATTAIAISQIRDMLGDNRGDIRFISYYDTAQIARPWLSGAPQELTRVAEGALSTLLTSQDTDGSWGHPLVPSSYRVLPTLATVSVLIRAAEKRAVPPQEACRAIRDGLGFLARSHRRLHSAELPDTVAIELIVAALLEEIDGEITTHRDAEHQQIETWETRLAPQLTETINTALRWHQPGLTRLHALRKACRDGAPLRNSLIFSAELLDAPPRSLCPEALIVGGHASSSPSATATILGWCRTRQHVAEQYLGDQVARLGGAPAVTPATVFERAWVASLFIKADITIPADLAATLTEFFDRSISPDGASYAPGAIPDGDDTAVVLYVLNRLAGPRPPTSLYTFEGDNAYLTFGEESNHSPTTNAHALEALASYPHRSDRLTSACVKVQRYLINSQEPDGMWTDKWHASPFYATACVVSALCYAPASAHLMDSRLAIGKAAEWVVGEQHSDGSWGHWCSTLEETAWALHILLDAQPRRHGRDITYAIDRGIGFLTAAPPSLPQPPMWIAKDLFHPERIGTAAVIAALHRYARTTSAHTR
jgi:halimadienyl-diphosphate synthase